MCGIAGILAADPQRKVEVRLVEEMARRIRHRGPDDNGVYCAPGVGLGHNRLAIIDPQHARQPMTTPDGRFVLVFNGEIYNFAELRPRIESLGIRFLTRSDTEVLLHWLVAFGVQGLDALNGMFAFVLWDNREKTALLSRDRLGIKPLYWSLSGRNLIFGSEIKAMLPALPPTQADAQALFSFLSVQNLIVQDTFFKGVQRLEPGTWLRFQAGRVVQGRYWDVEFHEDLDLDFDQAQERYRETLDQSVRRHLIADVPLGAYLSSGLDSGQVVMTAARQMPRPIETFTGAFTDAPYYDERPLAREVARKVGAFIREVEITPDDYLRNVHRVIYLLDEPTLGTGALPQYIVSELASRHVKVVLTGHGGDEMFAGYQVNKVALFRESLRAGPLAALKILASLRRDEATRFLYYLLYPLAYPEVGYGHFIMTPKKKRPSFFTRDFLAANQEIEPFEGFENILAGRRETPGQRLTRIYLKAYLPTLLMQEDRMSMGHSIEARTPLCDNAMLDLCLSLPLTVKLHGGELKAVPRHALRDVMPDALYNQPKRGFPTPFSRWYRREPLKTYVRDLLSDEKTRQRGVFNVKTVRHLFDANQASTTDSLYDYARANVIWSALAVELWFRTFIDLNGELPLST
jgi:asparagine synthase (glutamine-hydrolysing)